MAQATLDGPVDVGHLRDAWVARATTLVEQIAGWAAAEGWGVQRRMETVAERRLGTYQVPALTLHLPDGEVTVNPVALELMGRNDGRVDLQAMPTLSRVKLLGQPDGGWEAVAGANIPLRRPWTAQTFVQLVADLLS